MEEEIFSASTSAEDVAAESTSTTELNEKMENRHHSDHSCQQKPLLDLPLVKISNELSSPNYSLTCQTNVDHHHDNLGSPLDAQDSSLSSWAPQDGYSRSPSSSSISSSNSGWSSVPLPDYKSARYLISPEEIPAINPNILNEVEHHTKLVACNLDEVMKNIQTQMHKISNSTLQCISLYKDSVDLTCDSVDSSIKSMYALIAKCEELGNIVQPIYKIQSQIKEIKRLLDVFEKQLSDDEC